MKHALRLPPSLQDLSYQVIPARVEVTRLLKRIHSASLGLEEIHKHVRQKLSVGKAFLVGRPGGTESEGVDFFLRHRLGTRKTRRKPYPAWFRKYAKIYSGISHTSDIDLDQFNKIYLQSILESDIIGFGRFAPGALGLVRNACEMGSTVYHFELLEPWRAIHAGIEPWTSGLADKRVLIIHPFVDSIAQQLDRRSEITGVKDFLPDFSHELLSPPVTFAGEPSDKTWVDHLSELVKRVDAKKFDVALIGAGAYGLPIGAAIKASGRQAIHLGGVTQLLFGVAGKRWKEEPTLSGMVDSTWISPSLNERPPGHRLVEAGAYW